MDLTKEAYERSQNQGDKCRYCLCELIFIVGNISGRQAWLDHLRADLLLNEKEQILQFICKSCNALINHIGKIRIFTQ